MSTDRAAIVRGESESEDVGEQVADREDVAVEQATTSTPAPTGRLTSSLRIPFFLFLNASSSIGIVFANKMVFQTFEFKYGTLLTLIHFIFTFVGLEICRWCGVFELKAVRITQVLPLCFSFCGFVALTNLSLVYNTVGFYLLMKVLTTPTLVAIQTVFYGETFSTKIKLSLLLTCVGVILASVSDPQANFVGTVFALSALAVTAMYQIWVGTKQKELGCNSYQLLYYQAPISAVMLVPVVPVFDNLSTLTKFPAGGTVMAIVLSGVLAFLVNLTIFLLIGETSAVTYNVLGHSKLIVTLTGGFLLFGQVLTTKIALGILLTLCGVFSYTHFKTSGK